jgi:hypothetical protein
MIALRLGVLDIAIEQDRLSEMLNSDPKYQKCRICLKYQMDRCEDETHFLFECPHLEAKRKPFLDKINNLEPGYAMNNRRSLIIILRSSNLRVQETLADMAWSLLKARGTALGVCSRYQRV